MAQDCGRRRRGARGSASLTWRDAAPARVGSQAAIPPGATPWYLRPRSRYVPWRGRVYRCITPSHTEIDGGMVGGPSRANRKRGAGAVHIERPPTAPMFETESAEQPTTETPSWRRLPAPTRWAHRCGVPACACALDRACGYRVGAPLADARRDERWPSTVSRSQMRPRKQISARYIGRRGPSSPQGATEEQVRSG